VALGSADRVAFYQLKSMLQGVVARGTATSIKHLAPFVGGKTGTSENENDAWFVGFTNDVTVAVWVGHDNADGKRRTLGRGQTGGKVAVPIFQDIVQAAWTHHAPRTALAPPSEEARRQMVDLAIDLRTGDRVARGGGFTEHFRLGRSGRLDETQFRIVGENEVYASRYPDRYEDGEGTYADDVYGYGTPDRLQPLERPPAWNDPYAAPQWEDEQPRRRPRRIDPDYLWGRQIY
jgi:membrane carboxypeptidase/penicillin-binding protein